MKTCRVLAAVVLPVLALEPSALAQPALTELAFPTLQLPNGARIGAGADINADGTVDLILESQSLAIRNSGRGFFDLIPTFGAPGANATIQASRTLAFADLTGDLFADFADSKESRAHRSCTESGSVGTTATDACRWAWKNGSRHRKLGRSRASIRRWRSVASLARNSACALTIPETRIL
jgi:hypothetical protein